MSGYEMEPAVEKLSPVEFAEVTAWFAEYEQSRWDDRIERDLARTLG